MSEAGNSEGRSARLAGAIRRRPAGGTAATPDQLGPLFTRYLAARDLAAGRALAVIDDPFFGD